MSNNLALIGMAIIILSWIVQIFFSLKVVNKMKPCFAGLQLIGISLLVANTFQNTGTLDTLAGLNIASAVGALVMLIIIFKKK